MTDDTRPASPGETPAEGMTAEIATQTVFDESLGDEPGIADNLGPDGGDTPTDIVPPSTNASGEATLAEDRTGADSLGSRDRPDADADRRAGDNRAGR